MLNLSGDALKLKISGHSHSLEIPYYLQITENGKFILGEYNGTFIGEYNLQSGELTHSWDLTEVSGMDGLIKHKGWAIANDFSYSPALAGIICNPGDECYAAFFKNYQIRHQGLEDTYPLAFLVKLEKENPAYILLNIPISQYSILPNQISGRVWTEDFMSGIIRFMPITQRLERTQQRKLSSIIIWEMNI